MGAKLALSPRRAPVRFETVSVAGLRAEGHIADATLGLCWRAWLKMTTGGELGSRAVGEETETTGSDSMCVPFAQGLACCLR